MDDDQDGLHRCSGRELPATRVDPGKPVRRTEGGHAIAGARRRQLEICAGPYTTRAPPPTRRPGVHARATRSGAAAEAGGKVLRRYVDRDTPWTFPDKSLQFAFERPEDFRISCMSIARKFAILSALNLILVVLLLVSIYLYENAVRDIDGSNTNRLRSILLANEIRQSSDDLTRLGRTYVVTGDPRYKQQYLDVIDIRAGKKPRPREYYRIYWDYISAGLPKPRPDDEAVSVQALMTRLGFSQQETDALAEAVRNSDGLVQLEVEAMNLVEGKDAAGHPLAAVDPERDRMRAIGLLHSPDYHAYKAKIMRPLDDLYGLIEHRIDAAVAALQARARFLFLILIAALAASGAGVLTLAGFAYRALLKGYAGIGAAMDRVAAGDYAAPVPGLGRSDEVGAMSRCLEAFKLRLSDDAAARAAAAEASRERERRAQNEALADAFEAAIGSVVRTVANSAVELRQTAQSMSRLAETTTGRSGNAARAAEEASSATAAVAAAAEELGASVSEIARRATEAAALTRASSTEAEHTAALMRHLSEAATRVNDVVTMISAVAGQTNLLALNATIEAARAGDAGRGFAVVAGEVKELANQTAKATDEIATQIGGIQAATREAVTAIGELTSRFNDLDSVSTAIAASVEQQGVTTQEIVRNVGQAASGADAVSETVEGVASLAAETGAAANRVLDIAAGVSRQVDDLSGEVERLLARLRAA
ncbi:methyl-accepting chemotaxis protein [Methylobacterium sp. 2A]|uniref:methyl-accepting chemotaxis protein n=1 Tax=Methylobacterium sp. 2A TaxID=2603816 RepID=UPI0032B26F0C